MGAGAQAGPTRTGGNIAEGVLEDRCAWPSPASKFVMRLSPFGSKLSPTLVEAYKPCHINTLDQTG